VRLRSKDAAPNRGANPAAERHLHTDELVTLLGEHLAAAIPGSRVGLPAAPSGSGQGRARCFAAAVAGRNPPELPVRRATRTSVTQISRPRHHFILFCLFLLLFAVPINFQHSLDARNLLVLPIFHVETFLSVSTSGA
jgi:hypothetical protein